MEIENKRTNPVTASALPVVSVMAAEQDIITEKLQKIIVEKLGLEETQLKPAASFSGDLCADSLDVFELLIEVEKVFSINIPSEEAEKLTTVGKLTDYIKSNCNEIK